MTKIMKNLAAIAIVVLLPTQGFAKDSLKKFRWQPGLLGQPQLILGKHLNLLPGVNEWVKSDQQKVGGARVQDSWQQTLVGADGKIVYSAGAMAEDIPSSKVIESMETEYRAGLTMAMAAHSGLRQSSRVFSPSFEIRKDAQGQWQGSWRVEFLSQYQDSMRFLRIAKDGTVLEEGEVGLSGVDGRAMVLPNGDKNAGLQEVSLRDLSGDGTMTGSKIRVNSALDLRVWSPDLTFFFALDDRRFDLGQAYYTIEKGFRWLKDKLNVELNRPVDVKIHVGKEGSSNAAFYAQNTIYLGSGDGITYKDMLRDPSILIHESIHAIVDAYVGLPPDGEGGGFNEGFADLFAGLILENPKLGEASYLKGAYRRTLENDFKAYQDFQSGVYRNGSIVGGTFWDMKSNLGTDLTAKLAFRTLVRLGKGAKFDDFPLALSSACDGILSESQKRFVLESARRRGWKI